METTNFTRRALEERIRSLELENCQYDPSFFSSQDGNIEGGSSRSGSRRSLRRRTQSPNDVRFVFFLMRSCRTNLNLSCLALLEFALT